MAEAARRLDQTEGADVVRRLIVRPIRLEHTRHIAEVTAPEPVADESTDEDAAVPEEPRDRDALEAELALLKAVLEAERAEAATLRARLSDPAAGSGDGLAVRERWAALVDELLLRLR